MIQHRPGDVDARIGLLVGEVAGEVQLGEHHAPARILEDVRAAELQAQRPRRAQREAGGPARRRRLEARTVQALGGEEDAVIIPTVVDLQNSGMDIDGSPSAASASGAATGVSTAACSAAMASFTSVSKRR